MNKIKNIVIVSIIIFGLGSGLLISAKFSDPENTISGESISLTEFDETSTIKTFLIVGVYDIHAISTQLESLWIIEADFENFDLDLKPIYPTTENNAFQSLHEAIMVTSAGPVEVFDLGFVSAANIDHLIILDKAAFWTLIQLSDESAMLPIDHNQGVSFDSYPHVWENPLQTLEYQVGIISYLCEHSTPFSEVNRIEEMLKLINNYIFTDLSIEQILSYWQQLLDNDFVFSCEVK